MKTLSYTNFFILFFTFLLLASCQYDIDEVFVDDSVYLPPAPDLEVRELTLDRDTFLLTQPVVIKFDIGAGSNSILGVIVRVDRAIFEEYTSGKGDFTLDPARLSQGIHSFNLQIITNTRSGSIAEKIGMEAYAFESIDFVFYNLIKATIPIKEGGTYLPTGELMFAWDNCRYQGLHFRVEKYLGDENGIYIESFITESARFIDSSYAGEKAYYKVFIEDIEKGEAYPWFYFFTEKDIPVPGIDTIANVYTMVWEDRPYLKNLGGILIHDLKSGNDLITLPAGTVSWASPDFRFGDELELELITIPRNSYAVYQSNTKEYSTSCSARLGENFASIGTDLMLFSITMNNRLLYQPNRQEILSYDIDKKQIVDKLTNDGWWLYGELISYSSSRNLFSLTHNYEHAIFFGNPSDFAETKKFEVGIHMYSADVHLIDGSNEMILNKGRAFYFFDIETGMYTDTLYWSEIGFPVKKLTNHTFSPDGTLYYFLADNNIYMFSYADYNFAPLYIMENVFSEYAVLSVDPRKPSTFVHLDGENLYFRSMEDFSVQSSYSLPLSQNMGLCNIDYIKERILLKDKATSSLMVHDLNDGSLLHSLPANMNTNYLVSGNTILSKTGLRHDFTQ